MRLSVALGCLLLGGLRWAALDGCAVGAAEPRAGSGAVSPERRPARRADPRVRAQAGRRDPGRRTRAHRGGLADVPGRRPPAAGGLVGRSRRATRSAFASRTIRRAWRRWPRWRWPTGGCGGRARRVRRSFCDAGAPGAGRRSPSRRAQRRMLWSGWARPPSARDPRCAGDGADGRREPGRARRALSSYALGYVDTVQRAGAAAAVSGRGVRRRLVGRHARPAPRRPAAGGTGRSIWRPRIPNGSPMRSTPRCARP